MRRGFHRELRFFWTILVNIQISTFGCAPMPYTERRALGSSSQVGRFNGATIAAKLNPALGQVSSGANEYNKSWHESST